MGERIRNANFAFVKRFAKYISCAAIGCHQFWLQIGQRWGKYSIQNDSEAESPNARLECPRRTSKVDSNEVVFRDGVPA